MHNVKYKITGRKLIIEVDIAPGTVSQAPMSSTGKTILVASTKGVIYLPASPLFNLSFLLNVMAKKNNIQPQ